MVKSMAHGRSSASDAHHGGTYEGEKRITCNKSRSWLCGLTLQKAGRRYVYIQLCMTPLPKPPVAEMLCLPEWSSGLWHYAYVSRVWVRDAVFGVAAKS